MIEISQELYDDLLAHASSQMDAEVVGFITAPAGIPTDTLTWRTEPLTNAAANPEGAYEVSLTDLSAAVKLAKAEGRVPVAVYHSHPHRQASPSATDIELATTRLQFIVFPRAQHASSAVRLWDIKDGVANELGLAVYV